MKLTKAMQTALAGRLFSAHFHAAQQDCVDYRTARSTLSGLRLRGLIDDHSRRLTVDGFRLRSEILGELADELATDAS